MSGPVDVDEGADQMVANERGRPGAEVGERWRTGAARLREVLAAGDPHTRVDWVAGQLSLRTLATTRLAECWIHTGDVADALGLPPSETDRLEAIARLAWRTLPYAFGRAGKELHGPVAFELTGPAGVEWRFTPDEPAADHRARPGARPLPGRRPPRRPRRHRPHHRGPRRPRRAGPGPDVRLTHTEIGAPAERDDAFVRRARRLECVGCAA